MAELSQLDPAQLDQVLLDLENLIVGQTETRGGKPGNYGCRSTAGFTSLNQLVFEVATSGSEGLSWSEDKTWSAIEKTLLDIADDDYEQPQLLVAKIMMGLRETPSWDEFIPMPNMKRKSQLVRVDSLREGLGSASTFENSITLRRRYAAPLVVPGSTTESNLRQKKSNRAVPNHLQKVARRLLEALLDRVIEQTGGAFPPSSSTRNELALQANEGLTTPHQDHPSAAIETEPSNGALREVIFDAGHHSEPRSDGDYEPLLSGKNLGTARRRRSMMGWIGVSAAILAFTGVVLGIHFLNQSSALPAWTNTEESDDALVSDVGADSPSSQLWRFPDMLEMTAMEHCDSVANSADQKDGQEFQNAWIWQDRSCLTSSLLINPIEPFGLFMVYRNLTDGQTDDVTFWVELPEGFEVEANSMYYTGSSNLNGDLALGSLESSGVNVGSYGPGANVALGARIRVTNPALACAERGQEVRINVISSRGRDAHTPPVTESVYVTCNDAL